MATRTDLLDLGRLKLTSGEGRRLELEVSLPDFSFGEDRYAVHPDPVPVVLELSKMTGGGWSLRLRFTAGLSGPCMRCLQPADPAVDVDVREVDVPGGGEELDSPYLDDLEQLDLTQWANDAFALALPAQVVCRPDCAGLCPECGLDLNENPDHAHEKGLDPRWAALRDLKFEEG